MAIIICRECGNMVSDKAASCPHCGSPVNSAPAAGYGQPTNPSNGNTWLYVLIGGLGVLALILIIVLMNSGMCSRSTPTQPAPTTSQTVETSTVASAPAEPAKPAEPAIDLNEDGTYHLSGKVAGSGCKMDITINGSNVYGTYSYNRYRKPLELSGTKSGHNISLTEVDDHGETSGELNGRVSGKSFTGTHMRYETMAETHFSFTAN